MKKSLLISGLLLALTASAASAGGINLSWTNCFTGLGPQNATFACNTNTGAQIMFASFEPNLPQDCIAYDYTIDLQSAATQLPAWWDVKNATSCRPTGMSQNSDFTSGPFDCIDTWVGTVGGQDFSYTTPGLRGPNTARIQGGGAVPANAPVPVDVGSEYYAFKLTVGRAKTAGLGSCGGCADPVCLVLNDIGLYNVVGEKTIINAPRDRNFVTWQGGAVGGGCPAATPTNKATWGKIKSIYR